MQTRTREDFMSIGLVPIPHIPGTPGECAICADEFTDPVQLLDCKHTFCRACISQWLSMRLRNSCPNCRDVLFVLEGADRGPIDRDRIAIMNEALTNSALLTGGFQIFNDSMRGTASERQRAAAAANFWMGEQHHPNAAGPAVIDRERLGPHIVAMGNLIAGYAQTVHRPYSDDQLRDWGQIINALYRVLDARDGVRMDALIMPGHLRAEIQVSLLQDGLEVDGFFVNDAESPSLSGDLRLLLQYVSQRAVAEYDRRQTQVRAVSREPSPLGKVGLWARQLGSAILGS